MTLLQFVLYSANLLQNISIHVAYNAFLVLHRIGIDNMKINKANLRDLIAATGLVILLKLD